MRITVLILGLLLGAIMFIQTVLVAGLSSAGGDKATSDAGSIGGVVALLWLIACAFVIPFPLVSVVSFALSALFAFGAAATSDYRDMYIWGSVAVVLMILSFFGWLGKRKERRAKRAELATQTARDARYETLLTAHQQVSAGAASASNVLAPGTPCHACGALNPVGTRFCGSCGANLAANQPSSA